MEESVKQPQFDPLSFEVPKCNVCKVKEAETVDKETLEPYCYKDAHKAKLDFEQTEDIDVTLQRLRETAENLKDRNQ